MIQEPTTAVDRVPMPADGELVLIRLRHRNRTTGGTSPWVEAIVPGHYHRKPYASESGHFHGDFGFQNDDCPWDTVEILGWLAFSLGQEVRIA